MRWGRFTYFGLPSGGRGRKWSRGSKEKSLRRSLYPINLGNMTFFCEVFCAYFLPTKPFFPHFHLLSVDLNVKWGRGSDRKILRCVFGCPFDRNQPLLLEISVLRGVGAGLWPWKVRQISAKKSYVRKDSVPWSGSSFSGGQRGKGELELLSGQKHLSILTGLGRMKWLLLEGETNCPGSLCSKIPALDPGSSSLVPEDNPEAWW